MSKTKTCKPKVLDVAEYILQLAGQLSTWKLQKLVYYSQAWHCVWEDKPLFESKIEAWANGPVCRDLYEFHKGEFSLKTIGGNVDNLSPTEKESINMVFKSYGDFSGQQLSDLTHKEEPWKKARVGLTMIERGEVEISLESMAEYYTSLID